MPLLVSAPPIWDGYIDESSQNNHRYFVLGAIILPKTLVDQICVQIATARLPELPAGEMKWGKVSATKLPAYKRVVDLFFDRARGNTWHFHSLVVDTTKVDHAMFNLGSRDIGFNKEIFQLARKFGRVYPTLLFHVYPDRRTTTQPTEELRLMLNRHIRKDGDTRDWPYRRLQFRDSKATPLLQLADIFSGAIAFQLNEHHKSPGASPAKMALASHILQKAGIGDPACDTSIAGKFTIWHRILRSVP
jgi:hypothetical protein